MSGGATIELPRVGDPGSGLGGAWRVIVLNDDHNTFEHVAVSLARHIPGISASAGWAYAREIDAAGRAVVWSGHRELAEHYWQLLSDERLTMAPLEQA